MNNKQQFLDVDIDMLEDIKQYTYMIFTIHIIIIIYISMKKQHVLLKKDPSGHHLSSMVTCPDTERLREHAHLRSLAIPCLGVSTNGSDHRKVDPLAYLVPIQQTLAARKKGNPMGNPMWGT